MPRQIRPIRVCGDVAYVTLTQGHKAIIDAADVPLVDGRNWYATVRSNTVYAVRSGRLCTKSLMHRVILGCPDILSVDHKDGDGLNNRRENLRLATQSQNMHNQRINRANKTGFKGVSLHKVSGKWIAQIGLKGKTNYLGLFASPEEAHAAYCRASDQYHGDFGRTE